MGISLPVLPPVQDGRQVVYAHTVQQWLQLPEQDRVLILQNVKLKDRLHRFLYEKSRRRANPFAAPEEVPCAKCEGTGHITLEPRMPGIHPSQLPHPCLLKIWKEMNGEESRSTTEPRLQLIFDLGHAVHAMFQTYGLQGAWGPSYRSEVAVNPDMQKLADELWIEGHADAENILRIDDIPNSPYIYEVGIVHEYKTISSKQFESLTKPKPEHKEQAAIYSIILDRPVIVYVYFSKNDQNLADFPVPVDLAAWERIRGKCSTLLDHYHRQVPPQAATGYHCKDCGYLFNCEPASLHLNRGSRR